MALGFDRTAEAMIERGKNELREGIKGEVRAIVRDRLSHAFAPEPRPTAQECRACGKSLRVDVPRTSHAAWTPAPDRSDPVALLVEQGASRVSDLLPVRYARMSASPFTFYRGTALIMAADLNTTPSTGITVQACGDAHISNFGLFSSPERKLVFDINDFDETAPGPWEWDLKRLAVSVEICGRDRGFDPATRRSAVMAAVRSYREAVRQFADMTNLDVWYAHLDAEEVRERLAAGSTRLETATVDKTIAKARRKDSYRAVSKLTETVEGQLQVVSQPPLIVPLREFVDEVGRITPEALDMTRFIERALSGYRRTLPPERRMLIEEYTGVDVARKVVGVGSVGTRAWIVVLQGRDENDPLVLQVKEAQESVLERFVGKVPQRESGRRVVEGQRAIQMASDPFLGWTRLLGLDGRMRDFYVRQLWDGKGSFDLGVIGSGQLEALAGVCGWTLASAHARTGDRFAIAGYLGKSDVFDRAIADFSVAYADQNEADYERFMAAIASGELPCAPAERAF